MRTLVAFLVVLSILVTQSHGDEVFNIFGSNNSGGSVQETVSIDNEKNIATVNIHAGSCSSTTIFDYKHGYIASRLLSRRACYILKMDHSAIPDLDKLQRLIYEKQTMTTMDSSEYTWVRYNPLQSLIMKADWFLFGSPIKNLCKHVPLYEGEVVKKSSKVATGACAKAGLLGILGISICTGIHF
ncbi:gastrokine-2 [Nannospalax galili]|uniref:Gastrokine-2 n=1 Tax=Nannospalax galili TaxID=1026970 RepID=A0A8C6QRF5_NANGA|nr:gastrokine-2 [Nannospalax galili]